MAEAGQRRGVLWGVLTLVCGAFAVGAPFVSGLAVTLMIGIALLAGGVSMLVFAWRAPSLGGVVLKLLFAGLTLLAGIAVVARPGLALFELTVLVGVYFIVDGVVSMIVSWNVKPLNGWGWMTVNGVVSIALGYLILSGWPASALWAVGLLVGIRLLIAGVTMFTLGAPGRRPA
ncbi:MAG: DUF308 domain-containing protein [Xanthomonadales bacterium]